VEKGYLDVVNTLIEFKFDVNRYIRNSYKNHYLQVALENGHEQIALRLIQSCIEINEVNDKEGNTPLINSVRKGFIYATKALINAGSIIEAKNRQNETALSVAVLKGYSQIVDMLINIKAKINIQDTYGYNYNTSILLIAIKHNHIDIAIKLIKKGAQVNIVDAAKNSPLSLAIKNGLLQVVEALIEAGVNVNHCYDYNFLFKTTPLIIALQSGYLEIAIKLINAGADINQPDELGNTPLDIAKEKGCLEIINNIFPELNNKEIQPGMPMIFSKKNNETEEKNEIIQSESSQEIKKEIFPKKP
jgi:ankyrin repeat protein